MNNLESISSLSNRYHVMRHGHSLANHAGIIVSHPENGCAGYGLSDLGRSQVHQSLTGIEDLGGNLQIICSDFNRAFETAELAHQYFSCRFPLKTDERLRERHFGLLELGGDEAYAAVWERDALDPDDRTEDVESVNQLTRRITSLVLDCESSFKAQDLLLVSHGDALQLLQTAFQKQNAANHRQVAHLETAEIRRLRLAN